MLENLVSDTDCPWVNIHFAERLEFLRDLGVTTAILTGTASEPVTNMKFIEWFHQINQSIRSPFKHIELQTSGIMLDVPTLDRLDSYGVKTISLSLSSLDSDLNSKICGIPKPLQFDIAEVCSMIKDADFNLRLSLNMNDVGFSGFEVLEHANGYEMDNIFTATKALGADQITFRKLYSDSSNTPQSLWIAEHDVPDRTWHVLNRFIQNNGRPLQKLPFGAIKYSIYNMSTVIDDDCMAENTLEVLKYVILRRNCKLYSDWKDPASLIF